MKNFKLLPLLIVIFFSILLFNGCNSNKKSSKLEEITYTSDSDNINVQTPQPNNDTTPSAITETTVTICNQEWMTKNLDVSTYRNGDVIPQVTDPSQWLNLTTGAWCYYENNSANGEIYGKLYNWYAVGKSTQIDPLNPF